MGDRIQELVTEAHKYFNETLTSAIVDMDKDSAVAFLNECYDQPCPKKIGKYLEVVGELWREGQINRQPV